LGRPFLSQKLAALDRLQGEWHGIFMIEKSTDWRQVFLLWGIGLLSAAQFGKVSLAFEALRDAYVLPDTQLALVASFVGAVGIVFGAVAGMIVGRIGPRTVLLAALFFGGAMSLVQSSLPPFQLLLAARLLEGAAHLSLVVAAPVLMAEISTRKDQPMVMALWASFFGVSFALTSLVIPPILAWRGLSGVFIVHGGLMMLAGLIATRAISHIPTRRPPWPGFWAAHKSLYRDPARFGPALGFFWHTLMFVALLTFLPSLGLTTGSGAGLAASLPLLALVGTFLAGWLVRWIHPSRLVVLSFCATAFGAGALIFASQTVAIWVIVPLFISIGIVPGASFAAIPALNETAANRAEANGAVAQLGNVGTTSGTPLFAYFLATAGMTGLLGLTIVISLVGAVVVWMVLLRPKRDGASILRR
jgi:DHA1 family inner membrane transport protein